MRKLTLALIMTAGLITARPADALPIVDTGRGPLSPCGPPCNDWALRNDQWLAAQFSVTDFSIITGVEGWNRSVPFGRRSPFSLAAFRRRRRP